MTVPHEEMGFFTTGTGTGGGGGPSSAISVEQAPGVWVDVSAVRYVGAGDPTDPADGEVWLDTGDPGVITPRALIDGLWDPPAQALPPTYVGHGASATVDATTNLTPALPTGTTEGDILVAHLVCRATMIDAAVFPTGYIKIGQVNYADAGTGIIGHLVAWKRAGPAEAAQAFVGTNYVSSAEGWGVIIHGVRGAVTAGDPVNASAVKGHNNVAAYAPAVTTTVDNCLILGLGYAYAGGGTAVWSTWATEYDDYVSAALEGALLTAATVEMPTAGNVANQAWQRTAQTLITGASATIAIRG